MSNFQNNFLHGIEKKATKFLIRKRVKLLNSEKLIAILYETMVRNENYV